MLTLCLMCLLFVRNYDTYKYSYVLIGLQINPPKRPQSATNDEEGVKYRRLQLVLILKYHVLVESHPFGTTLDLQTEFLSPAVL